jgi:uncharacterized protein (TIGR02118 family)
VEATILLARRPDGPLAAWLPRSLAALALRFRDARVRLFTADLEPDVLAGANVPPPARFDTVVVVERVRSVWSTPSGPAAERDDSLAWLAGAQGYRAQVRRILERPDPPHPGQRASGLVFVATTMRAADLDADAFDAHWKDRHAPLALAHHAGLCGYEQLAVPQALTASATPIDGVALLHFADLAAYRDRFYDSAAGADAIRADTARFLDVARCEAVLMGEYGVRA